MNQENPLYSPQDYFILEEKAGYKSEYRQGRIVSMAGASADHNRITGNLFNALSNIISARPCEVFMSDLRLWVEARDLYTYPDLMVVCGGPQFLPGRTDTVTNPLLIVEVLSESTAGYDRGEKFHAYWTLASLQEYVLVDQYRLRVEYFRQMSEKEWLLRVLTRPDDLLHLESVGASIPLSQIYRNVTGLAGGAGN